MPTTIAYPGRTQLFKAPNPPEGDGDSPMQEESKVETNQGRQEEERV